MKKKWIPFAAFNAETSSAETPFQVRSKGSEPFLAVFNQHGQLLDADARTIVSPYPEEMEVDADAEKPAPAPTA